MDINQLILSFKQMAPQIASSYCIVNGAFMNLDEIQNMGFQEFSMRSKQNMPLKLYRYYPNLIKEDQGKEINYSLQALKDNTVFMQSPSKYDDVYDSDINMDYFEFERLWLIEYCNRCQIEIIELLSTQDIRNILIQTLATSLNSAGNINSAFVKKTDLQIEELWNELFSSKLQIELNKQVELGQAVANVILSDFEECSLRLKNTFRTHCFATTPYSQLMWGGSYADCHSGFCIEYTVLPNDENYKEVYRNLFPMIYCKTRPDMTERLFKYQNMKDTEENLWDIYSHGALRKSIDWAFQNEWRLLLPMRCKNISDYNMDFFPITKVFLGNRMSSEKRREVIEICHKRNIPYIGVKRNPHIFEMQDCDIKCEECFKYKSSMM